jgi:hypothetical protein
MDLQAIAVGVVAHAQRCGGCCRICYHRSFLAARRTGITPVALAAEQTARLPKQRASVRQAFP